MDIRQMKYFVTIVNEGNISRAAKVLNMSQPPLSSQIKQLEDEFGCLLFTRNTRNIKLTEAGRVFYERSNTILGMCSSLGNEMEDYQVGVAGTLHIGAVSSVCNTIFTSWLAGFHEEHPNINYSLHEANTYELIDQLRSGQIELALVRTPFNANELECLYLDKESMIVVGKPEYFESLEKERITIADMKNMPLIMYRRWQQILNEEFEKVGIQPRVICFNDYARTSIHLAEQGLGVGIIPESAIPMIIDDTTEYRYIDNENLYTSISAVYRKNTHLSLAAKHFLEHMKCQKKNLPHNTDYV